MKTIKQLADDLGVSKQTIRNVIAKLGLQNTLRKNANAFAIGEAQEMAIRQEVLQLSKAETQSKAQNDLQSVLRLLEYELEIKNKQIADLSAALKRTLESLQAEQALHGGTIQKQLTDGKRKWQFWRR